MRQLYKRSNRQDQSIENLMVQHKIVLKSKIFIEQETLCDNAVRDCAFDIYVVNN